LQVQPNWRAGEYAGLMTIRTTIQETIMRKEHLLHSGIRHTEQIPPAAILE
jgi:hypothetical protein